MLIHLIKIFCSKNLSPTSVVRNSFTKKEGLTNARLHLYKDVSPLSTSLKIGHCDCICFLYVKVFVIIGD